LFVRASLIAFHGSTGAYFARSCYEENDFCLPAALLPRLICALDLVSATHVLADDSGNADKTAIKTTADKNNAISGAEDGFGNQSGKESIGIYDDGNVRGFSPSKPVICGLKACILTAPPIWDTC
jgi:hypothetical protein